MHFVLGGTAFEYISLLTESFYCYGSVELLKVELPHQYKKETWQLNEDERLGRLPELKATGNAKFKEGKYKEASDAYAEALGILENLMLK